MKAIAKSKIRSGAALAPEVMEFEGMKEDSADAGSIGKLCATVRRTPTFRQARLRLDVIRQLHSCMRQQGLDQNALAKSSGISREELGRLFAGETPFTLDRLVALAQASSAKVEVRLTPLLQQEQPPIETVIGEETGASAAKGALAAIGAVDAVDSMADPEKSDALEAGDVLASGDAQLLEKLQATFQSEAYAGPETATEAMPELGAVLEEESAPKPEAEPEPEPEAVLDPLSTVAVMDGMKEHDRRFLDEMQTAFRLEKRERKDVIAPEPEPEAMPVSVPAPPVMSSEARPVVDDVLAESAALAGTKEEEQHDRDQSKIEITPAPQTEADQSSVVESDLDTLVVLAALEEMSGADKTFMQELWSAVQDKSDKRAHAKGDAGQSGQRMDLQDK